MLEAFNETKCGFSCEIFSCERVENIVGKGKNAGKPKFLVLLHFLYQNPSISWW